MQIVNKPPGLTINQFILDYKIKNNITKLCFAGRLDPMARGQLILLFDEECKQIDKYKSISKTYQFYIIIGIQTNSDDPLGIIQNISLQQNIDTIKTSIDDYLENTNKTFYQSFHSYSSKCINQQPLWLLTKNNQSFEKPNHIVKIYNYLISPIQQFNYIEWKNIIVNQIKTIDQKCDFNQENIINQWQNLDIDSNILYTIPIRLTVSSGFYVRQFVRDISTSINCPLMVYDINRINYEFDL